MSVFARFIFEDPDADGNAVEMRTSARPDLRGNASGGVMSSEVGARAFGGGEEDAIALVTVIEHWDAVARRIDADNERG